MPSDVNPHEVSQPADEQEEVVTYELKGELLELIFQRQHELTYKFGFRPTLEQTLEHCITQGRKKAYTPYVPKHRSA